MDLMNEFRQSFTDLVLELLKYDHKFGSGYAALFHAIRSHNLHIVERILTHFPHFGLAQSITGIPFLVAAEEDAVRIAEEIIRHCTIMAAFHCDREGKNALHIAVMKGNTNFVKFILSNPALSRLVSRADRDGLTALHLATLQCNPRIIRLLLENRQVKDFPVDKSGYTALDLAYYYTNHQKEFKWGEVVGLLSDAGCPLTAPYNARAFAKESFIQGIREHANQVTSSYKSTTSTVGILITTVTFAAAFTLPGGYFQDSGPEQGLPVFSGNAAFQAFLISDTFAMCASLMAAFICSMYRLSDVDFILHYAKMIAILMWIAYVTTAVAFSTGLYTVLAPTKLWLSIIIFVPCFTVPFLSFYFVELPALKLNRLVHRALKIKLEEVL